MVLLVRGNSIWDRARGRVRVRARIGARARVEARARVGG
jgi:hypothetical protein